jgi:signal peptidase II
LTLSVQRKKIKYAVLFVLSGIFIAIDQWIKEMVYVNLSQGESVSFIPHVLSITHIHNSGAAWSLLEGKILFFVLLTMMVICVILYYLWKYIEKSNLMITSLVLILSGAVGNLIDRVKFGYVIDMLKTDFMDFPIFNVADSCLVVGVFLLFLYLMFMERQENRKE